jgi:hypothetical protein
MDRNGLRNCRRLSERRLGLGLGCRTSLVLDDSLRFRLDWPLDRVRDLDGLDQPGRRHRRLRRWRRRLDLPRRAAFLHLGSGALGEDVALWQRDPPRARQARHELVGDDLLDRARRALELDAVIALEQCDDFLARGAEQFRDLVDPNS